jgi:DNA recombination protein RmuC
MSESARKSLTEEFQNLASTILEDKSRRFSEQNLQSLGHVLDPFKERLNEFKKRIEEMHYQDAQQQAMLKSELDSLKSLNLQMTAEAHDLATALKGQAKKQGNWGELVLENVLARSGLQEGKDYRREVTFKSEDGKQRPDVIIYLPDAKHLIVDAKVSLNAYTRYVNAEDELDRKQALSEHVKAVGDRIKELADRRYFELGELNSPEMVFMFVPVESAFVEALRADESLFQQALERNVLVATPTTLLTSLNIVRQLWRLEKQNAHSAALAESAGKLYHKLAVFVRSMEELGGKLDAARSSYTKAFGQLYQGRGNLIKQAKDFERLGVAVKAALPQDLVDKAELELDLLPYADQVTPISDDGELALDEPADPEDKAA